MPKKLTKKAAYINIHDRFHHLELIHFNGNNELATFLDSTYGRFEGKYSTVYSGLKNHPKRSYNNKVVAAKKPSRAEKIKITNVNKHGFENVSQVQVVKDKKKQTSLKRYGVEYTFQAHEVKSKIKETNLEKYGVEHASQSNKIKAKVAKTVLNTYGVSCVFKSQEIKAKIKETNLEKYGVAFSSQSEKVKNQIKKTNLGKYGVACVLASEQIKSKIEETNLNKYGEKFSILSQQVKNEIKTTNLDKYGVENVFSNQDVISHIRRSNLASGKWYNIDGYTLKDFYNSSELQVSYSHLQQNYKKRGKDALNECHYKNLKGKSVSANLWLLSIEDKLGRSLVREYHIPSTRLHADGYDPITNTIYEFYGDYWHGHPNNGNAVNKTLNISFNTLFYKTLSRELIISSMGYNITYIWENDY